MWAQNIDTKCAHNTTKPDNSWHILWNSHPHIPTVNSLIVPTIVQSYVSTLILKILKWKYHNIFPWCQTFGYILGTPSVSNYIKKTSSINIVASSWQTTDVKIHAGTQQSGTRNILQNWYLMRSILKALMTVNYKIDHLPWWYITLTAATLHDEIKLYTS